MAQNTITVERENGDVVCRQCVVADTFFPRLRGLLGRKQLAEDEGLLIRPAGSVHTLFMRFPIDVVFLDREDSVVKVVPALRPWRMAAARRAKRTLELAAGVAAQRRVAVGERLVLVPGRPKEAA